MTEFEGWLRKGLGRAAVFLKGNDGRQWREQLLYACTRNLTYDRQCEDSRVRYLLDLIEISGDTDFYRDRIVESLAGDDEDLDLDQMFEIAASFAANGSGAARTAMYSAFERYGFTAAGLSCAEQLVILDGLGGLLSVAKSFHEVEADERPWKFGALIELLEKHHGKQALPMELDGFVQELRDYEALCESERQKAPAARPGYETVKHSLIREGPTWARHASEAELLRAADDLLAEEDRTQLIGYLRMFRVRAFPRGIDRLLELARSEDSDIKRPTLVALSKVSNPRTRALALDLMPDVRWRGFAVRLLTRNSVGGDYPMIERLLEEQLDAEDQHSLGWGVREFIESNRSEEAERSLLLMYENSPCTNCRHAVVKELIAINRLPLWMIEECRHDADVETRKLVASIPNP